MSRHSLFTAALLLVQLAGCAATPSNYSSMEVAAGERKIIRQASASLTVEQPLQSGQQLVAAIEQRQGVIYSQDGRDNYVSIRAALPSDNLNGFLATLPNYGKVTRQDISQRDVTGSYADQQAKLDNLKALRDRLRTLLERAEDVQEVLSVEREFSRVQGEIDVLEGQLKRLDQQVAMSPLSLSLEQKRIYGPLGYLFKGIGWLGEKLFVIQ